jgi:hypothetical protein
VSPRVRFYRGFVVFAFAAFAPSVALAQAPARLSVAVVSKSGRADDGRSGACPSAALVAEELHQLMPDVTLDVSGDATQSDVVVADRDGSFSVKVRGQRRRFRDENRDCTERARHVAVFTVLTIDPLRVPSNTVDSGEEEPEPEPEPAALPRRAAEPEPEFPAPIYVEPDMSSSRPATFDLSLGPLAQVAVQSDQQQTTQAGGLSLRLRYGGNVAATLGIAGLLPTSLHFEDAEARATWVPMDFGLSLSQQVSSWEVGLEVGLGAALLIVEGDALDRAQRASRLELGGRLGAQVRYWAGERAGVYGGLSGLWFPKPYTLEVEGLGVVGRTPTGWIGGSLGAVIRL